MINERCKQRVLAVPAARQHFSRQVDKGFRTELPSVNSRSNQPALWTPYTRSSVRIKNNLLGKLDAAAYLAKHNHA
jgi:hypothetical protein